MLHSYFIDDFEGHTFNTLLDMRDLEWYTTIHLKVKGGHDLAIQANEGNIDGLQEVINVLTRARDDLIGRVDARRGTGQSDQPQEKQSSGGEGKQTIGELLEERYGIRVAIDAHGEVVLLDEDDPSMDA